MCHLKGAPFGSKYAVSFPPFLTTHPLNISDNRCFGGETFTVSGITKVTGIMVVFGPAYCRVMRGSVVVSQTLPSLLLAVLWAFKPSRLINESNKQIKCFIS